MSNVKFGYDDQWASGAITYTTQEAAFPATNTQTRRLTNVWRSAYSEASGGGFFEITAANQNLYFNEGAGSFTAVIAIGTYNVTELIAEIKMQMEIVGAHTYTVEYDFDNTLLFEITDSTGTFELEGATTANSIWSTIGYDTADTGLAASHTADYIRIHTYEYIDASLTASDEFDFAIIYNHNLQTTATVKFQFSDDNWVTISLEITPTRNGNLAADLRGAVESYRYRRIYIEDIDNSDGYVQLGRVCLYEMLTPAIGISKGFSIMPKDSSVVNRSLSGEKSSVQYPHIETRSYKFDSVDTWSEMQTMYDIVGTSKPVTLLTREFMPTVGTWVNPELYILYCTFTKWTKRQVAGEKYSLQFSVEEEK